MNDNHVAVPSSFLSLAMDVVLHMQQHNIICVKRNAWALQPRRGYVDPANRYTLGLHKNPMLEICIALEGKAVLDIEDNRYNLFTSGLAVIEPQVSHSEGYWRRSCGYTLMWLCCSKSALIGIVSKYTSNVGWSCPYRFSLCSRYICDLFDRFNSSACHMEQRLVEPVRADIMAILSEVNHGHMCKSSRPDATRHSRLKHRAMLEQVKVFIDNHFAEPLCTAQLCELTRLSPNYLNRMFSEFFGQSIGSYLISRRMENALKLLRETDLLIKEIACLVGYQDQLYFSRAFCKYHGCRPTEVR